MANIANTLKKNSTLLLVAAKWSFQTDFPKILNEIASVSKKICYVSLSKPFLSLQTTLKKTRLNADSIFILDLITRSVFEPKETDNCVYLDSPENLTDVSIVISEILKQDIDIIIFDSISTFLIYKESKPIIKFIHNIITKIKVSNKKALFLCIKEEKARDLIENVSMFVDKMIKV